MINLTMWEDPRVKRDPSDYDEIETFHLKSVAEIRTLMANLPRRCTAVSVEHSAFRTLKNGKRTNFFKFIWEKNPPPNVTYKPWDSRNKL